LSQLLEGVQNGSLWNTDELGDANSPEGTMDALFVPEKLEADSVSIPGSRTEKYVTLVGYICADGSFCGSC
jgi:hypothetical protein